MSSTTYYDDLIRDYLLYRGFTATLKAFEAELKADKDKGFRMSGEQPMSTADEWAKGGEIFFQDGADKEAAYFDRSDVAMLAEGETVEGEDNDTRSGSAEELSSEAGERSSDSGGSAAVDELEAPEFPSYHTKYGDYEDLEEDGEDAKVEILRAVVSESRQIQDMLRDFAVSVNARLDALENSFLAFRSNSVTAKPRRSHDTLSEDVIEVAITKSEPAGASPKSDSVFQKQGTVSRNGPMNAGSSKPESFSRKPDIVTAVPSTACKRSVAVTQKKDAASSSKKNVAAKKPLPESDLAVVETAALPASQTRANRDPRLMAKTKTAAPAAAAAELTAKDRGSADAVTAVADGPKATRVCSEADKASAVKPNATQPPNISEKVKKTTAEPAAGSSGDTVANEAEKAENVGHDDITFLAEKQADKPFAKQGISEPQPQPMEVSGAPLKPQPGSSGVATMPPTMRTFPYSRPADPKAATKVRGTQSTADVTQMFQQVFFQNDPRVSQSTNAKVLPVPRYIPSWFARACQQSRMGAQQAQQAQLAALLEAQRAHLAAMQTPMKAQPWHQESQMVAAVRPHLAPLKTPSLSTAQLTQRWRQGSQMSAAVRPQLGPSGPGVPNKFSNLHRYRPF